MHFCRWALLAVGTAGVVASADTRSPRLSLTPGEREPVESSLTRPDAATLGKLADAVKATPKDREARFRLVRALDRAGKVADALDAAKAWRAVDAYNLVVVRLIGDLDSELGNKAEARRAYSAVVELLPKDANAQRALASVLVQAGDLAGAYDRLIAAQELSKTDTRLAFELADVAARLGRDDEAKQRFTAIVNDTATPAEVRFPAQQRLAQLDHQLARVALATGHADVAAALDKEIAALNIPGGTVNDIKVYLTWDTDQSDVDLWVTNPAGERVYYEHKQGRFGESLFHDVTTGYGPESFTAPTAHAGDYLVQVNYFGAGRSNFSEARGEVVVVLDEGRPTETRQVLPYRLYEVKQTVTVARVHVAAKPGEG